MAPLAVPEYNKFLNSKEVTIIMYRSTTQTQYRHNKIAHTSHYNHHELVCTCAVN